MKTILVRANLKFNDELFTFCSAFYCSVCPVSCPTINYYQFAKHITFWIGLHCSESQILIKLILFSIETRNFFTFLLFSFFLSFFRWIAFECLAHRMPDKPQMPDYMSNIINTKKNFALPVNGVALWILLHVSWIAFKEFQTFMWLLSTSCVCCINFEINFIRIND